MARNVTWASAPAWTEALESVLNFAGGAGRVMWAERAVVVALTHEAAAGVNVAELQSRRWEVRANDVRLSAAMERWAREAGYALAWEAERDFPVDISAVFNGTFEEALTQVLGAKLGSDFPLQACLHEDPSGNRAVRIFRFGERKSCD